MTDFYDDDYDLDTDDEDASGADSDYQDGDDSGNGESWTPPASPTDHALNQQTTPHLTPNN